MTHYHYNTLNTAVENKSLCSNTQFH